MNQQQINNLLAKIREQRAQFDKDLREGKDYQGLKDQLHSLRMNEKIFEEANEQKTLAHRNSL